MPPPSRNNRDPTDPDMLHTTAACSLVSPSRTCSQNARCTSRRTGGRPGDRIAARPVNPSDQSACRPINTSDFEVLRRPVDFTLVTGPGVPPHVLINPDDRDPVQAGRVGDQDPSALVQDRVVRGVPCHRQPLGDPGHGQVLTHDPTRAQARPAREIFARGSAAAVVS